MSSGACGTAEQAAERCWFGEESSPQRLKPNSLHSSYVRPKGRNLQRSKFFRSLLSRLVIKAFTARLKPCPSSTVFPSLLGSVKASCAVQIGQLKNLIRTGMK